MAIKFNIAELLPAYLCSLRVYLPKLDYFPGQPGDQYSPFKISINQDQQGLPGKPILGPVLTQASIADWDSLGKWHTLPLEQLVLQDSVIWIVFHWLEVTPAAPVIGLTTASTGHVSYSGEFDGEVLVWSVMTDGNLMIQPVLLTNSGSTTDSLPDSYNIYRSSDSTGAIVASQLLTNLPGISSSWVDSGVVNSGGYYYSITALYAGVESQTANSEIALPTAGSSITTSDIGKQIDLFPDSTLLDTLLLHNQGDLACQLSYKIQLADSIGNVLSDNSGYTPRTSLSSQQTIFNWIDIEQDQNLVASGSGDDNLWGPKSLGFDFPFYGESFDSLRICANGFLSFTSLSTERDNKMLPNPNGQFNLIAPFWDDFFPDTNSNVFFKSHLDTAVVTFKNFARFQSVGNFTFQVILTDRGGITFQYLHLSGVKDSCTVGIQNSDGTVGLQLAHNQFYLEDSLAIAILPSWLKLFSTPDTLNPGASEDLIVKLDSHNLPRGQYHGQVVISTQDLGGVRPDLNYEIVLNVDSLTSVGDENGAVLPRSFNLLQNYPNPFNQSTVISYNLKKITFVTLTVYNLLGERVATLLRENQTPGLHQVKWEGKNSHGEAAASGIYFYKLVADGQNATRKLTLLR